MALQLDLRMADLLVCYLERLMAVHLDEWWDTAKVFHLVHLSVKALGNPMAALLVYKKALNSENYLANHLVVSTAVKSALYWAYWLVVMKVGMMVYLLVLSTELKLVEQLVNRSVGH
jgi:hypothetical protein